MTIANTDRYARHYILDPRIAQAVLMCKDDGNLVLDIELHEADHVRRGEWAPSDTFAPTDALPRSVGNEPDQSPEPEVVRITEPAIDPVPAKVPTVTPKPSTSRRTVNPSRAGDGV